MADLLPVQDEYQNENFKNLQQRGGLIQGRLFQECSFTRCDLSETTFRGCVFRDCLFKNCQMNLIKVPECVFASVRFQHTQILGVDWTVARWEKKQFTAAFSFENCSVNHNTFMNLNLRKLVMTDCSAVDANFEETDLTGCCMRGTDLSGSRFNHTNLSGADLVGARNYTIASQFNTLKKTRFSLPEALALLYALDIEIVPTEE